MCPILVQEIHPGDWLSCASSSPLHIDLLPYRYWLPHDATDSFCWLGKSFFFWIWPSRYWIRSHCDLPPLPSYRLLSWLTPGSHPTRPLLLNDLQLITTYQLQFLGLSFLDCLFLARFWPLGYHPTQLLFFYPRHSDHQLLVWLFLVHHFTLPATHNPMTETGLGTQSIVHARVLSLSMSLGIFGWQNPLILLIPKLTNAILSATVWCLLLLQYHCIRILMKWINPLAPCLPRGNPPC